MTVPDATHRRPSTRSAAGAEVAPGRAHPAPGVRALLYLLVLLPWPWGEEVCAALFVAMAVVRPTRLKNAFAWAADHTRAGHGRFPSAVQLIAFQGRFRARHALVGLRSPATFLRHVRITGEEHLPRTGGAILLGFHLGAPAVGEALCAAGHRVSPIGGARHSRSWSSAAWAPVREMTEGFPLSEAAPALGGVLYRARRRLLDGEAIYITADGGKGRAAFSLPIAGAPDLPIRGGWLALRRDSAVPVLPIMSHLDGRTQVLTIHPPLPCVNGDRQGDLAVCRDALATLVADYVRDFPEQCGGLVFGS